MVSSVAAALSFLDEEQAAAAAAAARECSLLGWIPLVLGISRLCCFSLS
jgi:hypothetical protein